MNRSPSWILAGILAGALGLAALASIPQGRAAEGAPLPPSGPPANGATTPAPEPKDGRAEAPPPLPPPAQYDPGLHGRKHRPDGTRHETGRRNSDFGAPSSLRGLGGLPEGN